MQQQRQSAPPAEPDTRALDEARAMFARAEEAWRRQVNGEDAAAGPRGGLMRGALLGIAIAAILFLLLQHLIELK